MYKMRCLQNIIYKPIGIAGIGIIIVLHPSC
jgi:hypothetical protein